MAKDELAALLLESGYDADQRPIALHLEALRTSRHVPVLDLGLCAIRYPESGPALRALLVTAADGADLPDEDATLLFRGLFLMGGARDSEAFLPLLRLLERTDAELDDLLGDLVTESLAKILAGTFDGDTSALFEAIVDTDRDQFVRDALLGAATFLAWDGRIAREQFHTFLTCFYEERLAEDGDYAWVGWLYAVALLGMRDLEPLVRKAWDEGRVPEKVLDYRHFEQDLDAAERRPHDVGRFHKANLGYVDDVLVELDWVRGIERRADEESGGGESGWDDRTMLPEEPVVNPWRHVGRNDPCPCGSGKKAKKCCLGTSAVGPEAIGRSN